MNAQARALRGRAGAGGASCSMSSARLSSSILAAPRPQTAAAPRPPQLPSTPRRAAAAPAKRRPTETAYFEDIFDPLFETINGNQGLTLPDRDMRTLLASTNTAEQLEKTLGLLEKQLENLSLLADEAVASDWAKRKLWYLKVCLLALEFKKPAIITKMFGDAKRYQLGTYFGREVVQRLASAGADVALLTEICHALLAQRGAGDKGVQAAYYELVHVVRRVRGAADALQLHREVSSKGVTVSPGFGKYLAKLSAKPEPAPGEKKAAAAAAAAVKTKQQRMPTMAAAQA